MKLHFKTYEAKFESLTVMFDLLRHALQNLGPSGMRAYMEKLRKPKEARHEKLIAFLSGELDFPSAIPDVTRLHKRKLSTELPITPSLKWAEKKGHALLGLNASELILRVAFFEAVMRAIHQNVLLAKPELMARVKPDRPVSLKDLFRGGFPRVKAEEMDRQVREADRLTTKNRAKFFHHKLKLPWGDAAAIKRLEELTKLRHRLVHSEPDEHITGGAVDEIRRLFLSVPRACFEAAVTLYPSHFQK